MKSNAIHENKNHTIVHHKNVEKCNMDFMLIY
jgi:hypothetical protein